MKIVKLLLFMFLSKGLFGQDTIYVENRSELESSIKYSFNDYVESGNYKIRDEINAAFLKYDFSGSEYNCQYQFMFGVAIDSSGFIVDCEFLSSKVDQSELLKFSDDVVLILESSNWIIHNRVNLLDSSYYFHSATLSFEISCDPSEIIFLTEKPLRPRGNRVVAFKEDDKVISFDGFKR